MKGDQSYFQKHHDAKHIFIFMDDSGKLSKNELCSVFAGICFLSKKDKDDFCRKYASVIKDIKCQYCTNNKKKCNGNQCVEIKSTNLKRSDNRRLLNMIKKEHTYGVLINNSKVYDHIMNDKASKGRYLDYTRKIIVKDLLQHLITNHLIDPHDDICITINCDQQSTASNGYYSLEDSIYEEIKHGISNFNYQWGSRRHPVIFGEVLLVVNFLDSKKVYGIQASDILAGEFRHIAISKSLSRDKKHAKYDDLLSVRRILP